MNALTMLALGAAVCGWMAYFGARREVQFWKRRTDAMREEIRYWGNAYFTAAERPEGENNG